MHRDMNRVLLETTIRRGLKEISDSPERGIRNLVDLGLNFSKGRFQQSFLSTAQQLLQNEDSAYYTLLRDVLTHVDPEILTTFGINLGYNSCTRGAKIIRAIEAERGFNIPWALSIYLNAEKLRQAPGFYPDLVRQGTELGIFTDLVFTDGDPIALLPLLTAQPDCAFFLFIESRHVTDELVRAMQPVKNAMLAVRTGAAFAPACEKLRKARLLYAAYTVYTQADQAAIVDGRWLSGVLQAKPAFAFLMADRTCPQTVQQDVSAYAVSVREGQQHPVFLMEVRYDMLRIDRIISDDVCMAGFGMHGRLLTHEGIHDEAQFNIFENSLEIVLRGWMHARK